MGSKRRASAADTDQPSAAGSAQTPMTEIQGLTAAPSQPISSVAAAAAAAAAGGKEAAMSTAPAALPQPPADTTNVASNMQQGRGAAASVQSQPVSAASSTTGAAHSAGSGCLPSASHASVLQLGPGEAALSAPSHEATPKRRRSTAPLEQPKEGQIPWPYTISC